MSKFETIVSQYLQKQQLLTDPFLLGLSGGCDSMALFHLLTRLSCRFEVAHIDHGWRSQSAQEARKLEKLCAEKQLVFHLLRLDPAKMEGNLEDECRKQRQSFFLHCCQMRGLMGVMLAHHGDDQAETVLKRVFEGSNLSNLKGLLPKTAINGLTIYRPLLGISKKKIMEYVGEHQIDFFHDETNDDPKYLRSRMRKELLPNLEKIFGKNISNSLCRMGEYAIELDQFLQEETDLYMKFCKTCDGGRLLDLVGSTPKSLFIYKALIRRFFAEQKISLPNSILISILEHLQRKGRKKTIVVSKYRIELQKDWLFLTENPQNSLMLCEIK